jgi:hypothetical protein
MAFTAHLVNADTIGGEKHLGLSFRVILQFIKQKRLFLRK